MGASDRKRSEACQQLHHVPSGGALALARRIPQLKLDFGPVHDPASKGGSAQPNEQSTKQKREAPGVVHVLSLATLTHRRPTTANASNGTLA